MGRPREHDESTRHALLEVAEQQLSRGEPLSVRGVADAVGTTTRAVYSLFGSMDGLHRALTARCFDEIRRRVDALPETGDPAGDLVRAGLEGFRSFAVEHPNLFRLGFERMLPGPAPTQELAEIQRDAFVSLHKRVLRCRDAGLLGARSAREVAWQFHALCQGLASVEAHGWFPDGADARRIWRDALDAFVAGLAHEPAGHERDRASSRERDAGPSPRKPIRYTPPGSKR